ncbi:hypothetical protein BCR34DRAFT_594576 [Clohesyomyces aquaticus]|uniref:Uncharacterized protein n=1 Tax=Clohesyomyces aquaticus TaxID=1231657 RepID=A0A1Y1Y7B7_9PLEO|nr:hypothetical protein BCR34DRAFT_594576 [Clohesyomyces aquaticus]
MPASKFRGPTEERMPIQNTKRSLPMPANASVSINEFLEAAVNVTAKLPSRGYHADNSFNPKSILFLVAWLLAFVNWIFSPRDIRDEIFRAIVKKNVAGDYITNRPRSTKNKGPSKKKSRTVDAHVNNKETPNIINIRVRGAKAIATFCYVFTTLALFSFPGIFVWSIVQAEIVFRSSVFIEQEGPRNVGQWGQCVGVALAAIAAVLDRLSGRTSVHIDIWTWHKVEEPPDAERP